MAGDVTFEQVPADALVPWAYIEFNAENAQSGPGLMPFKALLVGQRLAAATLAPLTLRRVTSAEEVATLAGAGSQAAAMAERWFANASGTEVHLILVDDAAAAAAAGEALVAGPATAAGTVYLYIAGRRLKIGVASAATASAVAASIVAAINADTSLPVTAAVDGVTPEKILFTARNEGEAGNGIDIRLNQYDDEELPAGVTIGFGATADSLCAGIPNPPFEVAAAYAGHIAFGGKNDPARPWKGLVLSGIRAARSDRPGLRLSGGTANPDAADVIAKLGDEMWNIVICPWTDTANLTLWHEAMSARWNATTQTDGNVIAAMYGTHSALGTKGDSLNSPWITLVETHMEFDRDERQLLLTDGISTLLANADGTVAIETAITTYKTNSVGATDTAYYKLNTPLTLSYLRYDLRNRFGRKYPRHKLAETASPKATHTMTPKKAKAELIAWAMEIAEDRGLIQDLDLFKSALITQIDPSNPNRLNAYLAPRLVGQFDIFAAVIGFRL